MIISPPRSRVHAVGKKHDRFASFDARQFAFDDIINRFVERSSVAEPRLQNRVAENVAIARRPAQNVNLFVERKDDDLVVAPQLIDESDCRILNFADLKLRRVADIEH